MVTRELDLTGFICPISKLKAIELLDSLGADESARIVLADDDSLKSVAMELKARGVTSTYRQDEAGHHVFSVTK